MNTTNDTTTPQIVAQRHSASWLAFTGDHDQGDARRVFAHRYGVQPSRVEPALGGLLLAGPVPGVEVTE
jgi:hypothetical protein